MLIETCWKKDFIENNTQPAEAVGATNSARRTAPVVEQGFQHSHIPMTVSQEMLSNTRHAQEQKGAITLTLFGPPRDIDKTTLQQPQRAGDPANQGTSVGHGKDTHGTPMPAGERRGWPTTRSTVRQTCTTKRQAPLSLTTYMVAEPCSVQFSSVRNRTLTDSLWAVASKRYREHTETRKT